MNKKKTNLAKILIIMGVTIAVTITLINGYVGELIAIALCIVLLISNHNLFEDELEDLIKRLK